MTERLKVRAAERATTEIRKSNFLFPTEPIDNGIADLLWTTRSPAKASAVNAIRHLNRAWKIKNIDAEMSALRCITAEEEAARAVILSVRRLRYPGAEHLNPKWHLHKFALAPYVQEIINQRHAFAPIFRTFTLRIDRRQTPGRLEFVAIKKNSLSNKDEELQATPPLHFLIKKGGHFFDIGGAATHLADPKEARRIERALKRRAKVREDLLYAPPKGLHGLRSPIDDVFSAAKRDTLRLLSVFLLVDPYTLHQHLVVQALKGFLRLLDLTAPSLDGLLEREWPGHLPTSL